MTPNRVAYMPLVTYPEAVGDDAVQAAVALATTLDANLQVTTFEVTLPRISSGLGDYLINISGIVEAAEEYSRTESNRLQELVRRVADPEMHTQISIHKIPVGEVGDSAAAESRYYDFGLLPWSKDRAEAAEFSQAIIFGSGRPTIMVPTTAAAAPSALNHIAIAWDASRVAARALNDALPLLEEGGQISVLTVNDEKPLDGPGLAASLASSLERRGYSAAPAEVFLGGRSISEALQQTALLHGAQLLAMGGFGHSRVRDFILGGATRGVLAHMRLPVLLSH